MVRAMPPKTDNPGPAYGWYALAVLMLVYTLNFIDRQMLTILAPQIKRDLGISNAQFGFLYGTAFGVFYAVFGIPLGKLADRWSRKGLLAGGLATWSAMTALCGLAGNFGQIAAARIGVGVGEATAGPCGYALLADYFPARRRATAIAIYSTGIYIGGGVALSIGTGLAQGWDHAFAPGLHPLGLAGWQVAFLGLGLPGLAMAAWVASLREPTRGRFDPGTPAPAMAGTQAWRLFLGDLGTIAPPFTLWAAWRRGRRALLHNVLGLAAMLAAAAAMTHLLGDPAQWFVQAVGAYAVLSWAQAMRHDDPAAFAAIWRNRALIGVTLGYGLICAIAYSATGFLPLYAMETFHAPSAQVALIVGGGAAGGGALGVIAGGWLGDRLAGETHHSRRVLVVIATLLIVLAVYSATLAMHDVTAFYALVFPLWFVLSMGLGASAGTVVNVVPAGLRGTATATFFLGTTLLGLSCGPYAAGRIALASHSLGVGLAAIMAVAPFALAALMLARADLLRRERGPIAYGATP